MAEGGQKLKSQPEVSIGYDENFLTAVDEDYICLICHLALREPVLTRCGHRFCRECLDRCLKWQDGQQKTPTCPTDRMDLDKEKDVFPDRATERKILSLAIMCPSEGCYWTGELRNKETHLDLCNFKLISCTNGNCKVEVPRKDLEEHATMECQWRTVHCDYCHELCPKCQMEEHIQTCKKFPVRCPECHTAMQQGELPEHFDKFCPRAVVQCPYFAMGCDVKMLRETLEFHLDYSARVHLDLACAKLNKNVIEFQETTQKLAGKIDALEKQQQVIRSINGKLAREVSKLKQESPPFVWRITGFKGLLKAAKKKTAIKVESGAFSTGPAGYNVRVVIYPNGLGTYENTHMSVFISLLKGKYDAILPWPFKKAVTFTLIDQQENELYAMNVVSRFIPDAENACFARPVHFCNSEYGFRSFISHDELQSRGYIVNDTLFLKVHCGPPQT